MAKSPISLSKPQKPTKPKSSTSTRKPSQTARILEHVETLLALHDGGSDTNSRPSDNSDNSDNSNIDRLIGELESWKKESLELHEEAKEHASQQIKQQISTELESNSKEILQSLESQIGQQLDGLQEQVSKITELASSDSPTEDDVNNSAIERLISEFETWQLKSAECQQAAQEKASLQIATDLEASNKKMMLSLESKFDAQLQDLTKLTEKVSAITESTSDSNKQNGSKQSNAKDSEKRIAELLNKQTVEIEAAFELVTEQVNEIDSIFDERFQLLDERFAEIADGIKRQEKAITEQQQTQSNDNKNKSEGKSDTTELVTQIKQLKTDLEEKLESATLQFEEKTNTFTDSVLAKFDSQTSVESTPSDFATQLEEQLDSQLESKLHKHLESRFEDLDSQISKITEAVTAQQLLIESTQNSDSTEAIVNSFRSQLNDLFSAVNDHPQLVSGASNDDDPAKSSSSKSVTTEDTSKKTHWHQQKEAMLSKYGIDPDYRPVMDIPAKKDGIESTPVPVLNDEKTEKLEDLHDSIESMSADDAEKIEQLKEELTSKLRDAEIELSINRAKLSQFKAQLEEKQVELDRRSSSLENKLALRKTGVEKMGFLARIIRHLSPKPDDKR